MLQHIHVIRCIMRRVELTIRSPTASAWLVSAILIISTGELYYEIQKATIAQLFDRPFTDGELMPIAVVLSLFATCSLIWLISLYCLPGKITLDPENRTLSRKKLKWFRQFEITHPLEDWRVEVTYFSVKDKENRHFKRILLGTTTYAEVLLFGDLSRGEELIDGFNDLDDQLGNYVVSIETR